MARKRRDSPPACKEGLSLRVIPGRRRIRRRGREGRVLPLEALPLKLHQAVLLGVRERPRRLLQLLLPPLPLFGTLPLLAQFLSLVGLQPAFFLRRELRPVEFLGLPDLLRHLLLGLVPHLPVLLEASGRRLGSACPRNQRKHSGSQGARPARPDYLIQRPR